MTEQTDIQRENRLAESINAASVCMWLSISAIRSVPADVRESVVETFIEVLREQLEAK